MSAHDDEPWDSVPDPSRTIPFKRSADGAAPTPTSASPAGARPARRQERTLHVPSLLLGLSAGVLAASALFALFFAVFALLA